MKKTKHKSGVSNDSLTSLKKMTAFTLLVIGAISSSQAINVAMSGTIQSRDQSLIDFINNSFQDVTLSYGDYSNPANIPAGTDLFIIGRSLSSTPFANSANSATFNALTIPVVCFTSYIARPDSGRWGWHSGAISGGWDVTGSETTVTAAGASILGVAAGTVDWFTIPTGSSFWGTGTGSVGDGQILATLGGDILAAGWNTGDQSGTGVTFGGDRLLFNLPQNGTATVVPDTATGQQALVNALTTYTTLQAVPEPGSMALASLGGGLALMLIRRRMRH